MNPAIKTHQINTYRVGDGCDVPDRARLRQVPSKLHTASLTEAEGSERLLLLFLSWSFVVKTVKGASLPRSRSEARNEVPPSSHRARARSWEDQPRDRVACRSDLSSFSLSFFLSFFGIASIGNLLHAWLVFNEGARCP